MIIACTKQEVVKAAWEGFASDERRTKELLTMLAGEKYTEHEAKLIVSGWQLGFYSALSALEAGSLGKMPTQDVSNN